MCTVGIHSLPPTPPQRPTGFIWESSLLLFTVDERIHDDLTRPFGAAVHIMKGRAFESVLAMMQKYSLKRLPVQPSQVAAAAAGTDTRAHGQHGRKTTAPLHRQTEGSSEIMKKLFFY